MMTVPPSYFLVLGAALFATGAVGFLLRRNLLIMLMSIELMLNGINLTLITFNRMHAAAGVTDGGLHNGQVMAFFIIAIAAAEAAVGLAIVLSYFRLRGSVRSDEANTLKH